MRLQIKNMHMHKKSFHNQSFCCTFYGFMV
nr:MAG TPA: hypothetical protein [Caudoviricetes sp.]